MMNIRFQPYILASKSTNLYALFVNVTPVSGVFLHNNIPEEKYMLLFNFR